jgi:hypothetical protein
VSAQPWPPASPTTVTEVISAYPYFQYQLDEHVGAFFSAYNDYAQAYLTYLTGLNLPIYTSGVIVGPLLDWVATGLYGYPRPALPNGRGIAAKGPPNTATLNGFAPNVAVAGVYPSYTATTDDTYKRCLTWKLYNGDGHQFGLRWLKRRINRFLNGTNGTDVPNDSTYGVSVQTTGFKVWTITLADSPESEIFQAAVQAGVLELPFQNDWSVVLT